MKIICIGRNYSEHAKELGNAIPSEPVFFIKPDTALLKDNEPFYHPDFSKNIQYEVEVVLKINKVGKNIQEKFAANYYTEIGLGIDFTARDIQNELKTEGLPWEKAKSFDHSAVISNFFISKTDLGDLTNLNFHLLKNKHKVQIGNSNQMLFNFDKIIHHVSKYITLKTGDLIFTGTPSGVGKIEIGDILEGYLDNKKMLETEIK
jgi:acylpyruvate hydrolase